MNASQRDELFGRLDERTENIQADLTELKEWQREQNGDIRALKTWQARLTGAFGVVAFVCLIVQDELREVVTRVFGG